jgi:uncharacterized protein YjbI with pentapeptide repeats
MTKKITNIFSGLGLLVTAVILSSWIWNYQNNNLQSLNNEINNLMNSQKTDISKSNLSIQAVILEKEINTIRMGSASRKQLLNKIMILKKQIKEFSEKNIHPKDRFEFMKDAFTLKKDLKIAENAIFNTIFQGLGGLFFFLTVVISWQNYQATQEKEIVERLSKAFEDLESDKRVVKLGGIYILERIAAKSEKEHWTIMEVLTSFVRLFSPREDNKKFKPITPVIQAAITAIGRRNFKQDQKNKSLDLSGSNLANADFRDFQTNKNLVRIPIIAKKIRDISSFFYSNSTKVNFRGTFFERSDLRKANIDDVDLSEANFDNAELGEIYLGGAKLIKASLYNANLCKANTRKDLPVKIVNFSQAILSKAKLTDARLTSAILIEANLIEADLCKAYLYKANFTKAKLMDTNFSNADLSLANLSEANLNGSILENTNLFKTNLISTKGLIPDQIKRAKNWENAIYNNEFRTVLGLSLDTPI